MSDAPSRACLIDLTRLVSRQGRAVLTGVDRVELAWLTQLLAQGGPLFGLVRTVIGVQLLNRHGCALVADMAQGKVDLPKPDLVSRLTRRGNPGRGAAETLLRRHAIARMSLMRAGRVLARHVPAGAVYLNLGHANLSDAVMRAVRRVRGVQIAALVHDTIPLDYPQFCRLGVAEEFVGKLAVIGRHADLVICSTRDAAARASAHLARLGRLPDVVVAPLGVALTAPDPSALPAGLDLATPYFVALGTIEPRKNIGLLLDVWADLPTPRPNLYLVGSRGWIGPQMAARLDAPPQGVVELSGLPDGAAMALLQGARALMFPSQAEGFGLPVLEAAALNTPILSANLPVIRELAGDYPVYASGLDRYSWAIMTQAALQGPRNSGQHWDGTLPAWRDHVATVLARLNGNRN